MSEEREGARFGQLVTEIEVLKMALREAILDTGRVRRWTIEVDPAGNTYGYEWKERVRNWARLCGLDLDAHDPAHYDKVWTW